MEQATGRSALPWGVPAGVLAGLLALGVAGCLDPQRAPYTGDGAADIVGDALDAGTGDTRADVDEEVVDSDGGSDIRGDGLVEDGLVEDGRVEDGLARDVGPDDALDATEVGDGVGDAQCDPPDCGDRVCGTVDNACGQSVDCGSCDADQVCGPLGRCGLDCGDAVKSCACALAVCQGADPAGASAWCDSPQGTVCGPPITAAYKIGGCAPACGGEDKYMPGIGVLCEAGGGACIETLNNTLGLSLSCEDCGVGCQPSCPEVANACGGDGCGGQCGVCGAGSQCIDHMCQPVGPCDDSGAQCECMLTTCGGLSLGQAKQTCQDATAAGASDCMEAMLGHFVATGCDTMCGEFAQSWPGLAALCEDPVCESYKAINLGFGSSCQACADTPCSTLPGDEVCPCIAQQCSLAAEPSQACATVPEECALIIAQQVESAGTCGETCSGFPTAALEAVCANGTCVDAMSLGGVCEACGTPPDPCLTSPSCGCVVDACAKSPALSDLCADLPQECQEAIMEAYVQAGGCGAAAEGEQLPGAATLCSMEACADAAAVAGLCQTCLDPCAGNADCGGNDFCVNGCCVVGEFQGEWIVTVEPSKLKVSTTQISIESMVWSIELTTNPAGESVAQVTVSVLGSQPFGLEGSLVNRELDVYGSQTADELPDDAPFVPIEWLVEAAFDVDGAPGLTGVPNRFSGNILLNFHEVADGDQTDIWLTVMGER